MTKEAAEILEVFGSVIDGAEGKEEEFPKAKVERLKQITTTFPYFDHPTWRKVSPLLFRLFHAMLDDSKKGEIAWAAIGATAVNGCIREFLSVAYQLGKIDQQNEAPDSLKSAVNSIGADEK